MIAHKKGHNPLLDGGEPSPPSHIKAVFATNEDREFYGPMAGEQQGQLRSVLCGCGSGRGGVHAVDIAHQEWKQLGRVSWSYPHALSFFIQHIVPPRHLLPSPHVQPT